MCWTDRSCQTLFIWTTRWRDTHLYVHRLAFTHTHMHEHKRCMILSPSDPQKAHTSEQSPTPAISAPFVFPHLFVPVLPEPHHLVHDALQGGEQGRVELSLHVHDPAAAPHWGCGPDGTGVRASGVWLRPHRTGLLLSGGIWENDQRSCMLRRKLSEINIIKAALVD